MKKFIKKSIFVFLAAVFTFGIVACMPSDGNVPHIGDNGNWFVNDTDTGELAQGPKGDDGEIEIKLDALTEYELYLKYNPEYSGSEQQWYDELASGIISVSTITFVTDSGATQISPIIKSIGVTVSAPLPPSRPGYLFKEWQLAGKPYIFGSMPQNDITLTAEWIKANMISFSPGPGVTDAVMPDTITNLAGKQVKEPAPPRRPGYHFAGWFVSSAQSSKQYSFTTMPDIDTVVYAKWVEATKMPVMVVNMHDGSGAEVSIATAHNKYNSVPFNPYESYTDPYVKASIGFGDREDGLTFAPAEFRARGAGSFYAGNSNNKHNWRIKFESSQNVFGFPPSRHWVLIAGFHNTLDKPMLKTDAAYSFTRAMFIDNPKVTGGQLSKGIEYATRSKSVELYINQIYYGVYTFSEHVRVGQDRINIESRHIYGAEATPDGYNSTGYLLNIGLWGGHLRGDYVWSQFEFDASVSNFGGKYVISSPDADDVVDKSYPNVTQASYEKQRDWIKNEIKTVATALNGENYNTVSSQLDIASFVDSYIVHELWRDKDAQGGCYIYKKPGGKFYAGPPWDFDATLEDNYNSSLTAQGYSFFGRLRNIPEFNKAVKARWQSISTDAKQFIRDFFNNYIDDTEYAVAFVRNAEKWRNFYNNTGSQTWYSLYTNAAGWRTQAAAARDWLVNRAGYLDTQFGSW